MHVGSRADQVREYADGADTLALYTPERRPSADGHREPGGFRADLAIVFRTEDNPQRQRYLTAAGFS